MHFFVLGFCRVVVRWLDTYRAYRAMIDQFRTTRIVNSLPPHIRKDIGWPDGYGVPIGREPAEVPPETAVIRRSASKDMARRARADARGAKVSRPIPEPAPTAKRVGGISIS